VNIFDIKLDDPLFQSQTLYGDVMIQKTTLICSLSSLGADIKDMDKLSPV
jgi:hypothetical protein